MKKSQLSGSTQSLLQWRYLLRKQQDMTHVGSILGYSLPKLFITNPEDVSLSLLDINSRMNQFHLCMFASPVWINSVTGIHTSCLYSLMQCNMAYLCLLYVGHRSTKAVKASIIAIYTPVTTNMAYVYLNVADRSTSIFKGVALDHGPYSLAELIISNPLGAFNIVNGFDVWIYDVISVESLKKFSSAKCKNRFVGPQHQIILICDFCQWLRLWIPKII